ncbi:MAG: hypothetical protein DI551_08595 [Micavibrio aeruginosavorus]|uniref:Competence protein ComEC n=1 Tax=Micavibrio aeruginosavorus TaxID=349221 RepID=A0A2W5N2L9_9BACT|nr:MAG: hypothetical protein DI551_08595 [Micavibrio aeruginosavorus]
MDLRGEFAAQKLRLFLWIPVAFAAGIAGYFALPFEPPIWTGLAAVLAAGALFAVLYRRQHDTPLTFGSFVLSAALLCACFGFCAAQAGTKIHGTAILEKSIGPADVVGYVESVERLSGKKGSRAVLSGLTIQRLDKAQTPRKIRVTFRKDEGLEAGRMISALVKLDPPSGAVAPGAYDFRRHLFFEGIGGVGFSFTAPKVIEAPEHSGASLFFEHLRTRIDGAIKEKAGPVTAGIMSALITGERGAIAQEDDDAMRASGLYHLLSISGTHVALVAGILFFGVRLLLAAIPYLALRYPIKKIAAVFALCGAAFYVVLAGADVPAQRALLSTALVMLAVILDRSPLSLRLVAFSALVVLTFAPFALIGVSFQMSFAAVTALIAFFDYIRPWWMAISSRAGVVRKCVLYVAALCLTSIIAGTATGFFSLYHFQQFAVYGVLSNMLAVPLTGVVIMPAAIASLILMPFGCEAPALQVMEWGTIWMLGIAHWTAGLEGAVIHVSQWPKATFVLFAGSMILFLLWEGWRGKGVAVFLMVMGLLFAAFHAQPDVYVSESGKLVAVRGDDGDLYFSSGRRDKFAAENWLRLSGREGEKPKTFKDENAPMLCDADGCRGEINGKHVSLIYTRRAFFEDRDWADVMIGEIPLPEERQGKRVVLGLFDFKDDGAHAVYLRGGVQVRSVGSDAGERPWTK